MAGVFSSKAGKLAGLQSIQAAQDAQQGAASAIYGGQAMALPALYGAQRDQLSALQSGYDTARNDLNRASSNYDFYLPGAKDAWNQTLNAAGVNGPGGYDAAVAAFRASPGYEWQKQQATDEANRGAAAGGQLLSGNTVAAVQDRASHLADQEYGQYYDRLQGISDRGQSAVGAKAGIDAQMGNLAYGYGGQMADIYGGTAGKAAGIYTGGANSIAQSLMNLGGQKINAYGQISEADQNAARNRLNLGIALANDAAQIGGRVLAPAPK